jgi:hypothetical protein
MKPGANAEDVDVASRGGRVLALADATERQFDLPGPLESTPLLLVGAAQIIFGHRSDSPGFFDEDLQDFGLGDAAMAGRIAEELGVDEGEYLALCLSQRVGAKLVPQMLFDRLSSVSHAVDGHQGTVEGRGRNPGGYRARAALGAELPDDEC